MRRLARELLLIAVAAVVYGGVRALNEESGFGMQVSITAANTLIGIAAAMLLAGTFPPLCAVRAVLRARA